MWLVLVEKWLVIFSKILIVLFCTLLLRLISLLAVGRVIRYNLYRGHHKKQEFTLAVKYTADAITFLTVFQKYTKKKQQCKNAGNEAP